MTAFFRVVIVAMVAVLFVGTPASASVKLSPSTAAASATVDLVFAVSNDGKTSATTRFEVKVDKPSLILQADVANIDGWSSTQERGSQDELTSVTWSKGELTGTATQDFTITALVPSDTDSVSFTATQAFADGTVIRYPSETDVAGPVLAVTGASTTTTTVGSSTTSTTPAAATVEKSVGWRGKIGSYLIWFGVAVTILLYLRTKQKNSPRSTRRR